MSNIGKVKWYNPNKGYGFITPEDESKDVFVHSSTLEKSSIRVLIEGQKVSYNIAVNKGRTSAVNIKTIEGWMGILLVKILKFKNIDIFKIKFDYPFI